MAEDAERTGPKSLERGISAQIQVRGLGLKTEVEIIRLICEGLNNEQIADRIHISPETVKTHRKNIHFKLGISKVTDLIQFAIRNGL
jgi:DNA-binding CsgD family transcriptional regulator